MLGFGAGVVFEGSPVALAGLELWAPCSAPAEGVGVGVGDAEECMGVEDEAGVDVGVATLLDDGVITVA